MHSWQRPLRQWGKATASHWLWQYRQLTWRYRPLPDFIIVGAQKSGTTSLYDYLSQHPQLLPSFEKEVHFFDGGLDPGIDNYAKGVTWYRANFPFKREADIHLKAFEASPLYLFNPLAPKRIVDLLPHVKLLFLLRNPTERAISHYFHEKQLQRESLSIDIALQAEENRLASILACQDYKNEIFKNHSYKCRGLYKEQLQRYFQYFDQSQCLILSSEAFFADPGTALQDIFKFVGVDPTFKNKHYKNRSFSRIKTTISPELRESLDTYFRPHNHELYQLIGQDFGW